MDTLEIEQTKERCKYVKKVVNALHMELDDFMNKLLYNYPYEAIIYVWINKLYKKGKSHEDALQLIYKARVFYLLKKYP
ncbi:hypothetical protein [Aquimarina aggregata]|uniref:hypothetical protein n=1 Tax=Aquimarina aggregata TaxID=1642818 RepID=UPI00248FE51E|nr:hypothetical protein [Aquimarina aggregata]